MKTDRPLTSTPQTDDFVAFNAIELALKNLHIAFKTALKGHSSLPIYEALYEENNKYLKKVEQESKLDEKSYLKKYQEDIALWLLDQFADAKESRGTDNRKVSLFKEITELYAALIRIKVRMKIAGVVKLKNIEQPIVELTSEYEKTLGLFPSEVATTLTVESLLDHHPMVSDYQHQLARESKQFEAKHFRASQTFNLANIDEEIARINLLKVEIAFQTEVDENALLKHSPLLLRKRRYLGTIQALQAALTSILERIVELDTDLREINALAEVKEEPYFQNAKSNVTKVADVAKEQSREKIIGRQHLTPWNDPNATISVPRACTAVKDAISTSQSYFAATANNEIPSRLTELTILWGRIRKHSADLKSKSLSIDQELVKAPTLAKDMLTKFTSMKSQAKRKAEQELASKKQTYLAELHQKRNSLLEAQKANEAKIAKPEPHDVVVDIKPPEKKSNEKESPKNPLSFKQKALNFITGKYAVGTSSVVGGTATVVAVAAFAFDIAALTFISSNPIGWGFGLGAAILVSSAVIGRNAYAYYKKYKLFRKLDKAEQAEFKNAYESLKDEGYDNSTLRLMVKLKLRPAPDAYDPKNSNEFICQVGHAHSDYRSARVPTIVLNKDHKKLYFLAGNAKVPINANNRKGFIKQIVELEKEDEKKRLRH